MRYARQMPRGEGACVQAFPPNGTRPLFEKVYAADTDEGWLLVDPEELRSAPSWGTDVVDAEAYGEGKLRGVKWRGEWDLVWVGDDEPEGNARTSDGKARRKGQVLHRVRYDIAGPDTWNCGCKLSDEGGDPA